MGLPCSPKKAQPLFLESGCTCSPAPPLPCYKLWGVWGLAGSGNWGAAQPNSTALRAPVPRAHSCHHSQPHAGDLDTPAPCSEPLLPPQQLVMPCTSGCPQAHGLLFPAVAPVGAFGTWRPSHNASRSAPLSSGPVLVPGAKDSQAFPAVHRPVLNLAPSLSSLCHPHLLVLSSHHSLTTPSCPTPHRHILTHFLHLSASCSSRPGLPCPLGTKYSALPPNQAETQLNVIHDQM